MLTSLPMAMRKAWLGLWLLLTLVWSAPARADQVADAEALFDAARDLAKSGHYAEACPKFEASLELDEQLGTLVNLADCYENLGRVATAWAGWGAAREWAKREGDDRLDYIVEGLERSRAAQLVGREEPGGEPACRPRRRGAGGPHVRLARPSIPER